MISRSTPPTSLRPSRLRASAAVVVVGLAALAGWVGPAAAATRTVSVSTTSLSFGSQNVGTTSASRSVTLTNTSFSTVTISAISVSGDFSRSGGTCGSSLGAFRSCTVSVVFSPTAAGTRSGALSFTDNAYRSPQTVTLSGTGVATSPVASLSPTALSFSGQTVGTTSVSGTVTLTNTGNATMTISAISASGDFARAGGTCGSTLGAGQNCTAGVVFTPTAPGTRTGSLTFTDDAAGSPQAVSLTGTGLAPAVSLNPASLTFASQAVNSTSAAQTVTVTNSGNAPLTVSSVAASGDFAVSAQNCTNAAVASGGTCQVSVTFTPVATGTRNGTLTLTDDAAGSPQAVGLSGTALAAAGLTVSPASNDFGSVATGAASQPFSFTVTNTGGVATGQLTASVSGSQFATGTDGCTGQALAAGATCTVTAVFSPTASGPATGTLTVGASPGGQATASLTGTGSTTAGGCSVYTVAHEDDSILFLNPDLDSDILSGRCVETIFLTAGDDGLNSTYWQSREQGAEAAYAEMAGVANTWTTADAGVAGHPMPRATLVGRPNVSIVFMRLPDGNVDGSGFTATGNQSLQELWQGTIPSITPVDGTSSYTSSGLTSVLSGLIQAAGADRVLTQDFSGAFKDGDHSDHHATAFFTQAAGELDATPHTLIGYLDYTSASQPANLSDADIAMKQAAWFAYAPFDSLVCQTLATCSSTEYASWWARQYVSGTVQQGASTTSTDVAPLATVTASSEDSTTGQLAVKAVDGSSDGYPGDYSHEWATQGQGAGAWLKLTWSSPQALTSIVLNDRPNLDDQITGGTISFSDGSTLAVGALPNDGTPLTLTFPSKTVTSLTLTVTSVSSTTQNIGLAEIAANTGDTGTPPPPPPPGTNVAPLATVAASSETASTGQLAVKAVDGSPDGYPGDYSHEWATLGQGVGAWLSLTWSSAQTLTSIVLYDRPNPDDQITGGTITFSDGSTLAVGTLPNDGTPLTLTFPAKTVTSMKLTVTSVSSTTQNAGLAEIETHT